MLLMKSSVMLMMITGLNERNKGTHKMGKRAEWTAQEIADEVAAASGHLATAASAMSKYEGRSKVTRQNLQTWINQGDDDTAKEMIDQSDILRINRNLTNTNNSLRRQQRKTLDAQLTADDVLASISEAVQSVTQFGLAIMPAQYMQTGDKGLTIELLFSDLQIGKLMSDYDTVVAQARVNEWVEVVTGRLLQYMDLGYHIEKIVLAVLGDIIESDKKHDNSGRACDIGTADQMKIGIDILFNRVVKHIAMFAPLDVVMITGNHDHDGHGLNMFNPGREHLSWPMYHAVRMLSEQAGIDAKFFIPDGSFHVHEIYGTKVLYEHGVGVATSGAAMKKHVGNRIDQLKEFITLFRMGDKHNICRFNNDRLVVNGAFFGDSRSGEEYSGIVGYDGEPAQLMFAHVERRDNSRTTIFDSLAIQLGHIK